MTKQNRTVPSNGQVVACTYVCTSTYVGRLRRRRLDDTHIYSGTWKNFKKTCHNRIVLGIFSFLWNVILILLPETKTLLFHLCFATRTFLPLRMSWINVYYRWNVISFIYDLPASFFKNFTNYKTNRWRVVICSNSILYKCRKIQIWVLPSQIL